MKTAIQELQDAKEYRSVWTIKGTIEIELNCFENE